MARGGVGGMDTGDMTTLHHWYDSRWFAEWLRLARLALCLCASIAQAADVTVVHTGGTTNTYNAAVNTDLSRGIALITAVSNGAAGDLIYLASKVFDCGPTNTLALNSVSPGMSLIGAGQSSTEVKTQCSFTNLANAFIQVGNATLVSDLKITDQAGSGVYSFPIGNYNGPICTNFILRNLTVHGGSDCIYFTVSGSSGEIRDCTLTSNWDCYYIFSPGGVFNLYNCSSTSTAGGGFPDHGYGTTFEFGTFNTFNCTAVGSGGATDNRGFGIGTTGTLNIYLGLASATGANACDLQVENTGGTINVQAGTVYSTTCGSPINIIPPTHAVWVNPLTNSTSTPGLIEITNKAALIQRARLNTWLVNCTSAHGVGITNGTITWDDIAAITSVCKSKAIMNYLWYAPYSVKSGGPELTAHPEWVSVTRAGVTNAGWLCLNRPEVRQWELDFLTTAATRWTNLAGVHLEEPGYETITYCCCNYCTNYFWTNQSLDITQNTTPVFNAQSAQYSLVNSNFVSALRSVLNGKGMRLTANTASYGLSTSRRIGLDWITWTTNSLIDGFYPQLYSTNVTSVSNDVAAVYAICPTVALNPGLGLSWSGFFPAIQNPATVVSEINTVMAQGANGFALFRLEFMDGTMADAVATTASTFYISTSGSDAASGTTTSTPWAHHPYMRSFTGSYTHAPLDRFVFRGGDTWGTTNFQMRVVTAQNYFGVDSNWFSGGSWSRPVFDFQSTVVSNSAGLSGFQRSAGIYLDGYDTGIPIWGNVFENLDIRNHRTPAGAAAQKACTIMLRGWCYANQVTNCAIHDWSIATPIGSGDDDGSSGAVQGVFDPLVNASGNSIAYCDLNQSGLTQRTGAAIHGSFLVYSNHIHFFSTAILGSGTILSNRIDHGENASDPAAHENTIYNQSISEIAYNLITNNFAQGIYESPGLAYPATGPLADPATGTAISLDHDNVIFATGFGKPVDIDLEGHSERVGLRSWNNTLNGGSGAAIGMTLRAGMHLNYLDLRNNHAMNDSGASIITYSQSFVSNTIVNVSNVLQSSVSAALQGYGPATYYAPISTNGATYHAGADLAAFPFMLVDYLGALRGSNYDAGAYQFIAAPTPPITNVFGPVIRVRNLRIGVIHTP